jgi:flagellar secretion chaperone FliS
MRTNAYQNYLEDQILTANPLQLVELLYRGALDSVVAAKRHLRSGDIRARSGAITKAMSIVTELSVSLNHQAGGELSQNLAKLYGYIQRLLIQANTQQCEPPLVEAERLLTTLLEAWNACAAAGSAPVQRPAEAALPPGTYEPVSCSY